VGLLISSVCKEMLCWREEGTGGGGGMKKGGGVVMGKIALKDGDSRTNPGAPTVCRYR
jgi:hypothetical protein